MDERPDPPFESNETQNPEEGFGVADKDSRTWAMLAHLSGILAGVLTGFSLCFLGPLTIWLIKKEENEFVNDQALEALNFLLTLLIAYAIIYAAAIGTCFVAAPLLILVPVLGVFQIIFEVIAAIKANEGERYRYPVNLRLIK